MTLIFIALIAAFTYDYIGKKSHIANSSVNSSHNNNLKNSSSTEKTKKEIKFVIARFQMPDGKIARFEFPENTPIDEMESQVAKYFNANNSPTTSNSNFSLFTLTVNGLPILCSNLSDNFYHCHLPN